jgi:hypothetical protein
LTLSTRCPPTSSPTLYVHRKCRCLDVACSLAGKPCVGVLDEDAFGTSYPSDVSHRRPRIATATRWLWNSPTCTWTRNPKSPAWFTCFPWRSVRRLAKTLGNISSRTR